MSWILRALAGVGGKRGLLPRLLLFLTLIRGPTASSFPSSSLLDRVFRVILLCCDSIVAPTAYIVSVLRMLAFLPHARKHTSARMKLVRDIRTIYTPIQIYASLVRGWEYVCRYTEYLALSIQRKGITYYRRLPARRTLIYCYPVRISCGKKRMPANPRPTLQRRSLRGFHPLPVVDRCFTSGRLSFALITFPSGVRHISFTIFIILLHTRSIRFECKYLNRRNSVLLYPQNVNI